LKLPLIIYSLLIAPLLAIIHFNNGVFSLLQSILGTAGVSLLILSLFLTARPVSIFFAKLLTLGCLMIFLLIRLLLSFVYDFSGRGFTSEFFAHFGWQSFTVGFDEYTHIIVIAIILWIALAVFLAKSLNSYRHINPTGTFGIMVLSIILIFTNRDAIPEWKLFDAYQRYSSPIIESLDIQATRRETSDFLEPLRDTRQLPIEKRKIHVQQRERKNIVIIYLESFSDILTKNSQFPGLTPNLDRLKSEHISFQNYFSAAYVTIEGLANSQCGTLMNMDSGSNSLTSSSGRLPNLPCLGDILKTAGYTQVYYGGADLEFAGKGDFFLEHGYDEVRGIDMWRKKGFVSDNIWGLSDSLLFDQAFARVTELSQGSKPFNLTLLTLGTHLPGFIYTGCSKYTGSKHDSAFLDAIHCTDHLVGKFIDQLAEAKILENTVVYIQGDHTIFPTHDMRQLFGYKMQDKRVLNIIIDPDKNQQKYDSERETSSMNLAPNILELLSLKHNVNFILARSDFNSAEDRKRYLLTRYIDFFGDHKITNATDTCNKSDKLTLPLDACEKDRAIKSVYRLGASYAQNNQEQEVCQLGVEVSIDDKKNKVRVRWGNRLLKNSFFSDGRSFNGAKLGFYLLLLNSNDQLVDSLFYGADDSAELNRLNDELSRESAHFVLLSNLSSNHLRHTDIKSLPEAFAVNKILYSQNLNGDIHSLLPDDYPIGSLRFFPQSCRNGIQIIAHTTPH
jgi:hypothetical protein